MNPAETIYNQDSVVAHITGLWGGDMVDIAGDGKYTTKEGLLSQIDSFESDSGIVIAYFNVFGDGNKIGITANRFYVMKG